MSKLFDLIVIGSGPAGQRAALQGAKAGKKVALVENYSAVGGGCVHWGTLPSKSFRESVYRFSLGSRGTLGNESEHHQARSKYVPPDMKRLLRRRDRVVSGESQVIFDQLKRNHITIFHGHARVVSPTEVAVEGEKGTEKLLASFIVIATGARPVSPPHVQVDGKRIHDSNTILTLRSIPKNLIVLGAGIIGCEFASMFSMAGSRVHLVDRRQEVLASVDREIVNHLVERFNFQGMEIHLGTEAEAVELLKSFVRVHLTNRRRLQADAVLIALGRFGNTEDLGLEAVGVERDARGLIKVDENFRTCIPTIYAVGDVIGAPALASTSFEQGRIATRHAFQLQSASGYDETRMPALYPYGIYTIPEISMIGRTEEGLRAEKVDFVAGRARYKELARGQIVGDRWGLLKLLVERKTLKLLGVHIIGDNAADLIHIGQAVMILGGDLSYFINSVFNYPTLAEAYKTAAFHALNQIQGTTSTR